ncbi:MULTISPECIES: winged helix-turn-helix domain-containing protein [unclassified Variovorax]|uniref:winged helix-turn-helix domain-containing protein n=1 Tax=unclassified Variovorax TaxID=663243 RepID=UPI003F453338
MNVLLLGAETQTRNKLGSALGRSGFTVDVAGPGDAESRLSAGKPYALVLLDAAPPTATRAAIGAVRRMTSAPLLVLTERDRLADHFEGLALDATEYLAGPYAIEDLLTRAWALTSRDESPDAALLRLADLAIDRKRGKAIRQGMDLSLSATLFELLDVLMAHRGHVMSRARLISAVWGARASHQHDNLVTLAILRLRQRLDDPFDLKLIHTVHRKGYVLEIRNDHYLGSG